MEFAAAFIILFVMVQGVGGGIAVSSLLAASNAAATAIIAGSSVASSANAASSSGASVSSRIEIENWTKYSLILPAYTHPSGTVRTPPGPILPGRREAMFTEKPGGNYGTWGTVSWLASGLGRRVVLMWSVPYSRSYYLWFGAGVSDIGITEHDHGWLYDMYYSEAYRNYPVSKWGTPNATERSTDNPGVDPSFCLAGVTYRCSTGLTYVKKSLDSNSWTIQYQDDDIEIRVSTGNSYKLESKVTVVPRREEDFAQAIKDQMQK